jgi:double-stranded uracil-DNA glycosylase
VSLVLPDLLGPGLRAVFVGTAAGDSSAARGHYYAGSGNDFWLYLHQAGLTGEYLGPDRDAEILRFGLGLTDVAKHRSAARDALLRATDYDVPGFVAKVERDRPEWIAFHGKAAAGVVAKAYRIGREIRLGPQSWRVAGVRVYVLPSASGSNRDPRRLEGKPSRLAWFREFRRTLEQGVATTLSDHSGPSRR